MAKRKITVTVDEHLIDETRRLGVKNISAVVNEALAAHVDQLVTRENLGEMLDEWEAKYGPPSEEAQAWARAAFDELDGLITPEDRGAA